MTGSNRMRSHFLGVILCLFGAVHGSALAAETVTYYYTNQQGTPLATADGAGNLLTTSEYKPYGAQAAGQAASGPGYTGHVNDPESGLVYMQARYYDPAISRFLSADPDGVSPGNSLAFGRYAYASNNPVGNVDPNGREAACVSRADHCSQAGEGLAEAPGKLANLLDEVNDDVVVPIMGANPAAGEEVSGALKLTALALRFGEGAEVAEAAAVGASEVPEASAPVAEGSFSVVDWTGYPAGVAKPTGPMRLLAGTEYSTARAAANNANRSIRNLYGITSKDLQLHEIKPVKFGGSPADIENKVLLPRSIHEGQVTPWWNQLQRDLTN
ncbi:RHS repeat-associated core domain-containing protein [Luteibacter aegosomaticola]|uniref:RHS repeat-associated core domain-containing protein n=1 Tax=Luteibacter aegosomaticola TaxID=2911538 RepID=UPI001FF7FBA1|nr:RHS repeat-associated core domain-containing protein [Luteibacter aegosomaticola]UPG88326.1 RHS repeat-associated core domain-containing protein [Luteibacter aegosomaticola]